MRPTERAQILALHEEDLVVSKRTVARATVRVGIVTQARDRLVEETLRHERVEVTHVPMGIYVDAVPPIREQDGVTILPVIEEVLVVERRLLLKEEVHVRRVQEIERSVETVVVRRQDALITRIPTSTDRSETPPQDMNSMTEETIVAVYDNAAHADAAVRDLEAAGVPKNAISRNGAGAAISDAGAASTRERGFWSSLFGGEPAHDTAVYDRSVESGSSVVTVKAPAEHVDAVADILDRHGPVDIDERAAGYGLTTPAAGTATTMQPAAAATAEPVYGAGEAVISLAEEQIAVGKRLVDRGTTRVRRFVVETPVEQDVTLHSERVTIERRPVSGTTGTVVPDFTDRTIEVVETDEEVVVGKTARVREEVVIRKDATDRVETIHDTVRREDVEITKDATTGATTGTTTGAIPATRPKI